jgi:hypothetical protein
MGVAGVPVAREASEAPSGRMTGPNVRRARPQVGKAIRRAASAMVLVGCLFAARAYEIPFGAGGAPLARGDEAFGTPASTLLPSFSTASWCRTENTCLGRSASHSRSVRGRVTNPQTLHRRGIASRVCTPVSSGWVFVRAIGTLLQVTGKGYARPRKPYQGNARGYNTTRYRAR